MTLPSLHATAKRFIGDESAATSIEYSLIAAGIAAAIVVTITTLGTSVKTKLWDKVADAF